MSKSKSLAIAGFVKPGFEAVREAFVGNFTRRNELGAACCIYYRGEKVVDLWGGIRNKASGDPWEQEMLDMNGLSPMQMGTTRCGSWTNVLSHRREGERQ